MPRLPFDGDVRYELRYYMGHFHSYEPPARRVWLSNYRRELWIVRGRRKLVVRGHLVTNDPWVSETTEDSI